MTFEDFHQWFRQADACLDGKAPDLKLWWELKARLDAVAGQAPGAAADRHDAPAASSSTLATPPPEIAEADDSGVLQPHDAWGGPEDAVDDYPASGLSVYEQAVTTLRGQRRA